MLENNKTCCLSKKTRKPFTRFEKLSKEEQEVEEAHIKDSEFSYEIRNKNDYYDITDEEMVYCFQRYFTKKEVDENINELLYPGKIKGGWEANDCTWRKVMYHTKGRKIWEYAQVSYSFYFYNFRAVVMTEGRKIIWLKDITDKSNDYIKTHLDISKL